MIDENPYAPPKSALEDFRQPEIMVEPTNMQRLVRVVLFPVLLPVIAVILYSFLHWSIEFFYKGLGKFELKDIKFAYLIFLTLTIIQSIIFSLILEFSLLNNRNKNIYSLLGGFLIGISVVLFMYLVVFKSEVKKSGYCSILCHYCRNYLFIISHHFNFKPPYFIL
ncbi:MAG: hypothetical protein IJ187_08690 [Neisseriaceae bacterium]|nr:hypothetical protein [Neisseriaceae bacterium]